MPKILVLVAILLLGFGTYFYFGYSGYYNFIKDHNQINPNSKTDYPIVMQGSAKTISYLALGDSLTAGVGVLNYQDSYPYILASNLAVQGQTVDLINLALPGATSADLIQKQLMTVVQKKPNYVTLLIGINDIHNRVSTDTFKANYWKIISTINGESNVHLTTIGIPYLYSTQINFWPYNNYLDNKTRQFNQIIKDLSAQIGVKYIDLYSLTRHDFMTKPELYSSDLFHPSAQGYKLWGDVINAN